MQDLDKKPRERHYINQFLNVCGEYSGYIFAFYRENPDLVYTNNNHELGFESIVVAADQNTADCYFEEKMCELHLSKRKLDSTELAKIRQFFTTKLIKHFRRYAIPTVLVFTVLDETVSLYELGAQFVLPDLQALNIVDYYLVNSASCLRLNESIT